MGSRNEPGAFDCYNDADDDEQRFTLLGRDPMAPLVLDAWIKLRRAAGDSEEKLAEAMKCKRKMLEDLIKRDRRPSNAIITVDVRRQRSLEELKGYG